MALSGTIYGSTVDSGYRLEIDWSATQNITANQSTVTANVYWVSLGSGYTVTSSATKTGSTTIDGSTSSWSTSGCSLSGNQKKLVNTYTHTVTHNSDGTKTLTISADYDVAVTLGSYVASVTASGSVTLNTIPRTASLTSSASWTVMNNLSLTVSTPSSSFSYKAMIYVKDNSSNYQLVHTAVMSSTSATVSFTTTENTNLFTWLAQRSSCTSQIILYTYNGSTSNQTSTTLIGSNTYYGTLSAPAASTGTISNPTGISETSGQENSTVYIDQTTTVNITRSNSAFTHTLNFKDGNSGSVVHQATGVTTSYSWTPSSAEMTTLYNDTPNSIEFDGQVDIITYYNGVQVQATYGMDINYRVRNSNPTFGTGYSYTDINTTTSGITGDPSYIIQNQSTLQVTIPTTAFATPVNGATMSSYNVKVNGVTKTATQGSSNIVLNFGAVNASTNQTLTVTAVDSRGLTTTTSMTVKMLPYLAPVVTVTASRVNGFEATINITLSGSISTLTTSAQQNALTAISGQPGPLEYCYAENVSGSTFSAWATFTYTTSGGNYTATEVTISLDNTKSYIFQVRATDKLQTSTQTLTVASGQPILFVDFDLGSVGVGKFPTGTDTFETAGDIHVQGNAYASSVMIVGNSTGNANVAWLGFYESDGATRKGWVGDGGTADQDITLFADVGNVKLGTTAGGTGLTLNTANKLTSENNTLDDGSTGQATFAGNIILGSTVAQVATPSFLKINQWTTSTAGTAQIIGGWQGSNYWGIGTDSNTGTMNLKLGVTNNLGVWQSQLANLVVTGNIKCVALTQTSDENLKTNIVNYADGALAKVNNTVVHQYQFKEDFNIYDVDKDGNSTITGKKAVADVPVYTGMIAQEVPTEMTTEAKDEVNIYSTVAVLWKAVQELDAKVNQKLNV